jgi:hypothetical protein
VVGRWRAPEAAQGAGGDTVGFLLVGELPQRRPGQAALHEESTPYRIVFEKVHRPAAVPMRQRLGFMLALFIREVDLQHRWLAVRTLGRKHERYVAASNAG